MITNRKFEREAAYRSRLAILVALVFHLVLLGYFVFKPEIQAFMQKIKQQNATEVAGRP
jgi:hypothetical protein